MSYRPWRGPFNEVRKLARKVNCSKMGMSFGEAKRLGIWSSMADNGMMVTRKSGIKRLAERIKEKIKAPFRNPGVELEACGVKPGILVRLWRWIKRVFTLQ